MHRDQFFSQSWILIGVVRVTIIDLDGVALHPPEFCEAIAKCSKFRLRLGVLRRSTHKHPDPPYSRGLLRTRGKRPCHRPNGSSFDEIASSHRLTQGRNYATPPVGLHQQFATDEMGFRVKLHGSKFKPPMSALCQKRTWPPASATMFFISIGVYDLHCRRRETGGKTVQAMTGIRVSKHAR